MITEEDLARMKAGPGTLRPLDVMRLIAEIEVLRRQLTDRTLLEAALGDALSNNEKLRAALLEIVALGHQPFVVSTEEDDTVDVSHAMDIARAALWEE